MLPPDTSYTPKADFWQALDQSIESLTHRRLADVFRFISFGGGETYGPHRHLRMEINYVDHGDCMLQLDDDTTMTFRENELMVIMPHTNHRFVAGNSGCTLIQLEFLPEIFDQLMPKESHVSDIAVIRVTDDTRIRDTLRDIIWEMQHKRPDYTKIIMLDYARLFMLLLRHKPEWDKAGSLPTLLEDALRIMRVRCCDGISVGEIARETGISDRHLRQLFRQHLGISPSEYLLTLRIEHAKSLLRCSGMTVKEVGYACGFGSAEYFSRIFREAVGVLAREYRIAGARSTSEKIIG